VIRYSIIGLGHRAAQSTQVVKLLEDAWEPICARPGFPPS
jgi:hypothetical protein